MPKCLCSVVGNIDTAEFNEEKKWKPQNKHL